MKTQKSTSKCSFVKIVVLRLTTDNIGSKRTNHKFGCFGEVRQTNILIPSKILFIWKCIFLNFFFQKAGRPCTPQPLPIRDRTWIIAVKLSDFRSHQLQLDCEFVWAENLFRAVISLCLKHAFLKRSVPLNVAKAAINGLIILNLSAKCYSPMPYPLSRSFNHNILHALVDVLVQVN